MANKERISGLRQFCIKAARQQLAGQNIPVKTAYVLPLAKFLETAISAYVEEFQNDSPADDAGLPDDPADDAGLPAKIETSPAASQPGSQPACPAADDAGQPASLPARLAYGLGRIIGRAILLAAVLIVLYVAYCLGQSLDILGRIL